MTGFPNAAAWREACAEDAVLTTWAGPWAVSFAIASGNDITAFDFVDGRVATDRGRPAFSSRHPSRRRLGFLNPFRHSP